MTFDVGILYEAQAKIKFVTFLSQPHRTVFTGMYYHACHFLFEEK